MMVPSISNTQLGVSTSAGGKLILNTDKNGMHSTTNHDSIATSNASQANLRNKKIKPYKSN